VRVVVVVVAPSVAVVSTVTVFAPTARLTVAVAEPVDAVAPLMATLAPDAVVVADTVAVVEP
jgi:hypothetical protein